MYSDYNVRYNYNKFQYAFRQSQNTTAINHSSSVKWQQQGPVLLRVTVAIRWRNLALTSERIGPTFSISSNIMKQNPTSQDVSHQFEAWNNKE